MTGPKYSVCFCACPHAMQKLAKEIAGLTTFEYRFWLDGMCVDWDCFHLRYHTTWSVLHMIWKYVLTWISHSDLFFNINSNVFWMLWSCITWTLVIRVISITKFNCFKGTPTNISAKWKTLIRRHFTVQTSVFVLANKSVCSPVKLYILTMKKIFFAGSKYPKNTLHSLEDNITGADRGRFQLGHRSTRSALKIIHFYYEKYVDPWSEIPKIPDFLILQTKPLVQTAIAFNSATVLLDPPWNFYLYFARNP